MEKEHEKDGLVLLAVSLDEEGTRPKIPGFLKKYGIGAKVLLGDSQSLKGYDTRVASSLYVVDRKGILAGVPSEFYAALKKKIEARLPGLLAGKPTMGPVLWALETSPPGFGLLWRQASEGNITALAVAPATGKHRSEIGVLGDSDLKRYSPSGKLLGDAPLDDRRHPFFLQAGDLDGDGNTEWIAGGAPDIGVMDDTGEEYWQFFSSQAWSRVAAILGPDGDGRRELVIQDGPSVEARGPLSETLWRTPPHGPLRSVVPDPLGAVLVQTERGIQALDRSGRFVGSPEPVPVADALKGRIDLGGGRVLDVFGPTYNVEVDVGHDLDGDGEKDVLVAGMGGLAVYSRRGKPLLVLRITSNQFPARAAFAKRDGDAGDELVLAIPDYGLVALGVSPDAKPVGAGSPD